MKNRISTTLTLAFSRVSAREGTRILINIAVSIALLVVVLGAYTRLTQAGLGCPDWPGCYGHLVLPNTSQGLASAQHNYPTLSIEPRKAWTEMVHRYAAATLATLIISLAIIAIIKRRQQQRFPLILPLILCGLLVFQAALGMWTVTLKLLPVVVMGHLLGGLTILACLWWLRLQIITLSQNSGALSIDPSLRGACDTTLNISKFRPWVLLGIMIVVGQIALGGWVSANYAGLACVGFPTCNGNLFPHLAVAEAFKLTSPIGANYQGGLLDSAARISIQMVHRYGAMLTASYLTLLSLLVFFTTKQRNLKMLALMVLLLIVAQFTLGILNVILLLPLGVALAHNAVAALTLLAIITLAFYMKYPLETEAGIKRMRYV